MLCAVALFGNGCATTGAPTLAAVGRLDAKELRLIESAGPAVPLPMVKDGTPVGNRFLRTPSLPITPGTPGAARLVARMRASLRQQKGVGIAAPQVGIGRRVVLVQRFEAVGDKRAKCDEQRCPVKVYFNPIILERSDARERGWEGCLSIARGFGQVQRASTLRIAYQDAQGQAHEERVRGFTARIFQHEVDHVAGALFIDRKDPGPLMPVKAYRAMRAKQEVARRAASQPSK